MKRLIITLALVALTFGVVGAQDIQRGSGVGGGGTVLQSCLTWTGTADQFCDTSLGVFRLVSGAGAGALTPVWQLGGTTASFPAFRRNGTVVEYVLADASNYTTISGLGYNVHVTGGVTGVSFYGGNTSSAALVQIINNANTQAHEFNVDAVTATSCGSAPSPTVTAGSTGDGGSITVGGGAVTACTINFTTSWSNAPTCAFSDNAARTLSWASAAVGSIVVNGVNSGDIFAWACSGHK